MFRPIADNEVFYFSCGPEVPCFNACCRDLNQFLAPYDVLRLARHLDMHTGDFLAAYTLCHDGPQTGLPVVTLKPAEPGEKQCPFVAAEGCRVYENRPGSCRMYPLARMLRRARNDGSLTESYALIREAHCRGFEQGLPMTAEQWIADQGLEPYNELNDAMIDVISVKQQYLPGPVKGALGEKLFAALYDIDAWKTDFHPQASADSRHPGFPLDEPDPADDEALLRFAMQYAAALLRHESGDRPQTEARM
ncbi:MAG: YkgJ family cysteine cluster protein [Desulfobacterales bacterium]|nr:YkgJ family cysteine cluster protein [Desulfobacterales bacterium]